MRRTRARRRPRPDGYIYPPHALDEGERRAEKSFWQHHLLLLLPLVFEDGSLESPLGRVRDTRASTNMQEGDEEERARGKATLFLLFLLPSATTRREELMAAFVSPSYDDETSWERKEGGRRTARVSVTLIKAARKGGERRKGGGGGQKGERQMLDEGTMVRGGRRGRKRGWVTGLRVVERERCYCHHRIVSDYGWSSSSFPPALTHTLSLSSPAAAPANLGYGRCFSSSRSFFLRRSGREVRGRCLSSEEEDKGEMEAVSDNEETYPPPPPPLPTCGCMRRGGNLFLAPMGEAFLLGHGGMQRAPAWRHS